MGVWFNLYLTWRSGGHHHIWCLTTLKGKRLCTAKLHLRIHIHHSFFAQCVDAFVDELWWKETDSAKHDKICKLNTQAKAYEWRVGTSMSPPWFVKCTSTVLHTKLDLMCFSMPITPSMHFHPRIFQHFIMQYLHLKPSTERGLAGLPIQNIICLLLHFMPHVERLMSTMEKQ